MPFIEISTFRAPAWLRYGHFQTIIPNLFRQVSLPLYVRERILTPDDDFVDIDWRKDPLGRKKLVVISHGLEASSTVRYVRGMSHALYAAGYDIAAWNFRGCSGEDNQKPYSYHTGASHDLRSVLDHILSHYAYEEIKLVGFSAGGNITLKYLGEEGTAVHPRIRAAAAFSVPVDLEASAAVLAQRSNFIYMRRFLGTLCNKVIEKRRRFPDFPSIENVWRIRTFAEFDERFVAPLFGFASAVDYWRKASSKPLLGKISVPTLLVNAKDDPFLDRASFPIEEARQSSHLSFEMPHEGGHVGFVSGLGRYWAENRAVEFFRAL